MARRAPGEGSICRRSDGRWQAALQVAGRRLVVYGRSRAEAARKLAVLRETARRSGRLPSPGRLTLREFLTDWLVTARPRLRPTTRQEYGVLVDRHILPALGTVRLDRLDPLLLSRLLAAIAARHSPRRARQAYDLLHKALGDAVRLGLLATNPAALLDPPRAERRAPRLWSPEQVGVFVAAIERGEGGWYGPLLAFLLASGCRIGEALGLRWSAVDWAAGTVRIERQVVQVGRALHEGPPKSPAGRRTIALPALGLAALRRQRAAQASSRLRAGDGWPETGRCFTTTRGSVPGRRGVLRSFQALAARLDLPRLRLHDLRHLHLSLLAMQGVPVKVAQARAGHAHPTTTLGVYQHVLGDADRRAAEALDHVLGGVR